MRRLLFKRRRYEGELNLTSLMDMFTIMLFFFLTQYSDENLMMKLVEGIQLPRSTSQVPLAEKHYIAVLKNKVVIDEVEYKNDGTEDMNILTELKAVRDSGINYIVIQADKELPFYLIRNYIRLAVQAGFSKPFLAVTPK